MTNQHEAPVEVTQTGTERARERRQQRDASGELYVDGSIYEGMEACLVRGGRTVAHVHRYVDAIEIASQAADIAKLREVVEWYGEQARLARLIHSEGNAGRHALADDGGKRARTALQETSHDR